MAKLTIKELQKRAVEIVQANPEGIRYLDVVRQIAEANPDTPINTVAGAVSSQLIARMKSSNLSEDYSSPQMARSRRSRNQESVK